MRAERSALKESKEKLDATGFQKYVLYSSTPLEPVPYGE